MNVLKLNRTYFRKLGICSERNATRKGHFHSVMANVLTLVSYLALIFVSVSYLLANLDDITNAIYCVMQIVAYVEIGGTYATLMARKTKIFNLFENLEEFVKDRQFSFFHNLH